MPGHQLVQATPAQQVATPTADASFANKPSANFLGAQWYDSTLPETAWRFTLNGTGMESFVVFMPTAATTSMLWATMTAGGAPGNQIYFNPDLSWIMYINSSPIFVISTPSNTLQLNSPTYVDFSWKENEPFE